MAATTKTFTEDDVRARLKALLDSEFQGSPERMAIHVGCTSTWVRMVLSGTRPPPSWATEMVGMEPKLVYFAAAK